MSGPFSSRVALVTSAGSGIERASAQMSAREGARVVADRSPEGGDETVRLIASAGGGAVFVRADVSKAREGETLVQAARTVEHSEEGGLGPDPRHQPQGRVALYEIRDSGHAQAA